MIRALPRVGLAAAILLAGATALAAPPPGAASPDAKPANPRAQAKAQVQAKAEAKRAQLDYKLARFDEALQGYSHAYELFPTPAFLFNLGQCHRNLKNYERAVFFFEGYLREQPKIDPEQRALTEDLIAESKAALDRERADAAAVAARLAAPPMTAMPARKPQPKLALQSQGAGTANSEALVAIDRGPAPHDAPVTHRWWFWTAIVGTAVAASAVAYYATGDPRLVAPSGSVGTLDRR